MFTPSDASRRATSVNAFAVTGRPSTISTCEDSRRAVRFESAPISISTCIETVAMACSTDSCRPSGSWSVDTSAPSTSRPRITTCSTSSTSTPCLVSTAKSTEETPGLSGPVTVMSTGVFTSSSPR